jgi:hypothetical protein
MDCKLIAKYNELHEKTLDAFKNAKKVENEELSFIHENYKYKLEINYNCNKSENIVNKLYDTIGEKKIFGEYYFTNRYIYVKDFWIPDIDFSDFKNCYFEFENSSGKDSRNIILSVHTDGSFQIRVNYAIFCNLSNEEFMKLKSCSKRDMLLSLIINNEVELVKTLLTAID